MPYKARFAAHSLGGGTPRAAGVRWRYGQARADQAELRNVQRPGRMVGLRKRDQVTQAVGQMPDVRRVRDCGMTDEIECPDCAGLGTSTIGPLVLRCQLCLGSGKVGGKHEPAEDLSP